MQNKLLVISLMFITSEIAMAKCFLTTTSHIESQKKIEKKEEICESKYKDLIFYVSKKCFDKHNECLPLLREETVEVKNAYSEFGSPGFKLCYTLKGNPQIFEYKKDNAIEESDRCLLGSGLWVEIPFLMKLKNIK